MAAGAVVILLFSVLIAVSAQAEETGPTVVPVYGDGGKTPSAYVITGKDSTMYFCSITAGSQVYTCQQLRKGGN